MSEYDNGFASAQKAYDNQSDDFWNEDETDNLSDRDMEALDEAEEIFNAEKMFREIGKAI